MSLTPNPSGFVVDFGFEVDDRFVQVSYTQSSDLSYYGLASDGFSISPNQVVVYSAYGSLPIFVPFYVFVY